MDSQVSEFTIMYTASEKGTDGLSTKDTLQCTKTIILLTSEKRTTSLQRTEYRRITLLLDILFMCNELGINIMLKIMSYYCYDWLSC